MSYQPKNNPPAKADPVLIRAGFVALCGRPNVGKSTLLNHVLGQHLSIVSPKPQTTRNRILGVCNLPASDVSDGVAAQIALVDTPGLHLTRVAGRTALNHFMVQEAHQAMDGVDLDLFVLQGEFAEVDGPASLSRADDQLLEAVQASKKPVVVAVNKIDLVGDKRKLLPLIEQLAQKLPGVPVVPICAKNGDGVTQLVKEVVARLPLGSPLFPKDVLTDRNERFLVSEFVREQVFLATQKEVPYSVAVTVDNWQDHVAERGPKKGQRLSVRVDATIHVEKLGQKRILVGEKGALVRQVGTLAREKATELLGCPVHLFLFVRVDESWSQSRMGLRKMGYETEARR